MTSTKKDLAIIYKESRRKVIILALIFANISFCFKLTQHLIFNDENWVSSYNLDTTEQSSLDGSMQ